jgi:hypothetical protein
VRRVRHERSRCHARTVSQDGARRRKIWHARGKR